MITDLEDKQRDGRIHPCNGYVLVERLTEREDIIVVEFSESYKSAIVVETSDDETDGGIEVRADTFEWRHGDLIYFKDSIEVDSNIIVHWTDIVAYKRF